MWILDVGRLNLFGGGAPIVNLQPKLVIYDLNAGCIVRTYLFPETVLPANNSFANDIVLDEENGLANISDTWALGGLIVYSYRSNTSRRWDHVSFQGNKAGQIEINGVLYPNDSPSDGIALSPDRKYVYYSSVSYPYLYRVETLLLKNFDLPNGDLTVELVGTKGYSDGMAFDSVGNLYYGSMERDAIMVWNTTLPFNSSQAVFYTNEGE
jgi:hypothetical protein